MFDGMYLRDIVLLFAGVVLFVVLLIAFLRQIFTNRPYKGLLMFFFVPIVMIGWPAISQIKIEQGVVEIQKQTDAVQKNPQDAQARGALQAQLKDLEGRPFKDPKTLASIGRAQFALGNETAAQTNLQKALATNPTEEKAQDLKKRIDVANQVKSLTQAAEQQPNNPQVKQNLATAVRQADQLKLANPNAIQSIEKAKVVLAH
jgi:Flp pilus assembly protein TadD